MPDTPIINPPIAAPPPADAGAQRAHPVAPKKTTEHHALSGQQRSKSDGAAPRQGMPKSMLQSLLHTAQRSAATLESTLRGTPLSFQCGRGPETAPPDAAPHRKSPQPPKPSQAKRPVTANPASGQQASSISTAEIPEIGMVDFCDSKAILHQFQDSIKRSLSLIEALRSPVDTKSIRNANDVATAMMGRFETFMDRSTPENASEVVTQFDALQPLQKDLDKLFTSMFPGFQPAPDVEPDAPARDRSTRSPDTAPSRGAAAPNATSGEAQHATPRKSLVEQRRETVNKQIQEKRRMAELQEQAAIAMGCMQQLANGMSALFSMMTSLGRSAKSLTQG